MDLQSYGSFASNFRNNNSIRFYDVYIVDLDADKLHLRDEKVFNDFINKSFGFTSYI